MSDYVGAILAAGRGSRMGILSDRYPKSLLPVANQPLVVHHLQILRSLGIEDVNIVVGRGAKQIVEMLGDGQAYGVRIRYVEQGAPLGSAHAVSRLATLIDGPFVLLLGDYFFSAPGLGRMLERARATGSTIVAAKREPDRQALCEACVLEINAEGRVEGITEKPKVLRSDIKGCGIYICRPEVLDAVRRTPRTALRDEYEFTVSLDVYLQMGGLLYAEEIIEWDTNFTRPADVLQCNLDWLRHHGRSDLVGRNVELAQGCELLRAVVGDNVTISQPAILRDVVLFSGTRAESGGRIEYALVTPEGVIDCRPM
jgi:glucose-1-phosphate thymidylyltransferase